MIAALYVRSDGPYLGLPGVDMWDEARDARDYPGPHAVVAHPPCSRWCQLAHVNQARYGHKVGDDDGMFEAALAAVREWGGVLEHPAHSRAWAAFGLHKPHPGGGWSSAEWDGGWTCQVEQGSYGHRARKATWLYARRCKLPSLKWGPSIPTATVSFMTNHGGGDLPRLSKREASATPPAFRDILIAMARSATPRRPPRCPRRGAGGGGVEQ